MKLASRSWKVGRHTVTMTVVLPIKIDAPHHAGITWDPADGEPMTDVEEAQYASGLSAAIKSITAEQGALTSSAAGPVDATR